MTGRLLATGLVLSSLLAAFMTFLDWRANPAGLFRGSQGTNWSVVGETAWSWWWPALLISSLLAFFAAGWLRRRRP